MELVCLACNSTFLDITPVKWRIVRKNETGSPEPFCAIGSKHRTSVRTDFEAFEREKQLSKIHKNLLENCSCYITLPPQLYHRRVRRTTGGKELKKYSLGLYRIEELLRLGKTSKVQFNLCPNSTLPTKL